MKPEAGTFKWERKPAYYFLNYFIFIVVYKYICFIFAISISNNSPSTNQQTQ